MTSSPHVTAAVRPQPDRFPLIVGTASVNWNNTDLKDWRPHVPFPDLLHEMASAGYRYAEWDQSYGADIDTLNTAKRAAGICYCGAYRWVDLGNADAFHRDLDELLPHFAVLQQIGVSSLIVSDVMRPERIAIAGSVPADGSRSLDDAGCATIASNLVQLHEAASEFGLNVRYHNHVGSYIETPAELDRLCAHLEGTPITLCFDTGHYAFGGGNAIEFMSRRLASIGYIHLKDVDGTVLQRARTERWSFLDALRAYVFCLIDQGIADVPGIIDLLVTSRFPGPVIIEQDTCRGDATATAKANFRAVQRLMHSASGRK